MAHMSAGNEVRDFLARGDALAMLRCRRNSRGTRGKKWKT
jgi:hypothetical protein